MLSALRVCEFLAADDYEVSVHEKSDIVIVRVTDRDGEHSLSICLLLPLCSIRGDVGVL